MRTEIRELGKLQSERDEREKEIKGYFDRQITHIREVASELLWICSDAKEAARYFTVTETEEIDENEFNLNLPRYMETFDPEEDIPLPAAIRDLYEASKATREAEGELLRLLAAHGVRA